MNRFLSRFDKLMGENRFDEAGKLLEFWLKETESNRDAGGQFTVLNEMTGFYRMRGERKSAFDAVNKLLKLADGLGKTNAVGKATAYLNCATVYNSFNEPGPALKLYRKAEEIYKSKLGNDDTKLAGLYNNMALALMVYGFQGNIFKVPEVPTEMIESESQTETTASAGQTETTGYSSQTEIYLEAGSYFDKAMEILKKNGGSYNEQAITYLNMADLEEKKNGPVEGEAKIVELLDKAAKCLEESYKGEYVGFKMCAEKCIPVFGHYGYFGVVNELKNKIASGNPV